AVFVVCLRGEVPAWFVRAARAAPRWLCWLPLAWPAALAREGAWMAIPGAAFTLLVLAVACSAVNGLLQGGTVRSHGVDPGTRGPAGIGARGRRLHGVLGKDLRLLLRDRNFLVQTVLVPLVMIGMQLFLNPGVADVQRRGAAVLAYAVGAVALTHGCFQVLSG